MPTTGPKKSENSSRHPTPHQSLNPKFPQLWTKTLLSQHHHQLCCFLLDHASLLPAMPPLHLQNSSRSARKTRSSQQGREPGRCSKSMEENFPQPQSESSNQQAFDFFNFSLVFSDSLFLFLFAVVFLFVCFS